MSNDIEYYEFTYKIPKYKIKPPLNFCKYYQIHKDEIIIELQQENKQLKEVIENDIDRYEDTISYHLGFDKGKEELQNRIKEKIKDLQENNNGDDYSLINVINILKDLLGDKENERTI